MSKQTRRALLAVGRLYALMAVASGLLLGLIKLVEWLGG